jgi:hypothetical protein
MPYIGFKAILKGEVETVIEIARLLVKEGHDPKLIQKALIDPIADAVNTRIKYGEVNDANK